MANQQARVGGISRVLQYPWHFAAMTSIFMVWGYLLNPDLFDLGQVLQYTVLGILTAAIVFMVFKRFIPLHNAGLLTTIYVLLFFAYGHVYEVLIVTPLVFDSLPRFFIANFTEAYIGLTIIILILMSFQKRQLAAITTFLNVMTVTVFFLMVSNSVSVLSAAINPATENSVENEVLVDLDLSDMPASELPDIYYLVLDGYPGNGYLQSHFGIDNSQFTAQLEELGFYVAYDSVSNYTYTIASVSSSLNMDYVQDLMPAESRAIDIMPYTVDNAVGSSLQELGYEYITIAGGYLPYSTIADLIIDVDIEGELVYLNADDERPEMVNDYQQYLYRTTVLRVFESTVEDIPGNPNSWYGVERINPQIEALKEVPELSDKPTFTFFHLLKPHFPVVLDAEGNHFNWLDYYDDVIEFRENEHIHFEDQLTYTNKRVIEAVEAILRTSDEPPIIIIQGDHASSLPRLTSMEQSGNYPIPILNAYYFPDQNYDNLRTDITPVNSFRVIFNQYFGMDYSLLPEVSYFQPYATTNTYIRKLDFEVIADGDLEPPFEAAPASEVD